MRKVALLPIAVFTLIFLMLMVSAVPLFDGVKEYGRPPAQGQLRTVHRVSGHWFVVLMWLVLPVCALVPLCLSWRNIRRKGLAVFSVILACLGAVVFTLLTSFTGFLIHSSPPDIDKNALLRMKTLHGVGFPFLLVVALIVTWAISIRLARRVEQGGKESPTAPPPG